jgi:cytochrome c556
MKRLLYVGMALVAVTLISFTATAQVTKGKTRPALTKQIMSGLVRPNCAAIGEGVKEAPADDKAWQSLATNAALLNEASYILMDDGRCPDAVWANAAKTLRTTSAAALERINEKDAAGAAAEFKKLTKSCAACHKAHKES